MPDITALDRLGVEFLNQFSRSDPSFDQLVVDIADSALLKGGLFMAYFWWLWFRPEGDSAKRRSGILLSLAGAILAVAAARVLQRLLPSHDRPLHAADLAFLPPVGVKPETLSDWSSFPSDHAALFFALSAAIWVQSRSLGALAAIWGLLVIGLPRIYLGYHYPSDVLAGALLGIGVTMVTLRLARSSRWPGRVVTWSQAHQMAFYCLAFLGTYELTILFYDLRALAQDGIQVLRSVAIAAE